MAKGDSTKAIVASVGSTPKLELVVFDLSFASGDTYKTGGFSITPANLNLSEIFGVIAIGAKGYECAYVKPNLLLYRQTAATSALVQVPDATDISAISPIRLLAVGLR